MGPIFPLESFSLDLGGEVCQPNEIRCTNFGRGRKCVQKFWMCDGDRYVIECSSPLVVVAM